MTVPNNLRSVHSVHGEFRTSNTTKNSDFSSSGNVETFGTEGTEEVYFSESEVDVIQHDLFKNYLARVRSMKAAHDETIDGLCQEYSDGVAALQRQHDNAIEEIEKQWRFTLRQTENELRAQIAEQAREIDRLTRPDPQRHDKELFRQIQVMRGAGISRNKIVEQVLGGKLEGNSRLKWQREYDRLVFAYGGSWLQELHSYGLSPQKIVEVVWGSFKDGSAPEYIARVEQAIGKAETASQSNVIPLHRAG